MFGFRQTRPSPETADLSAKRSIRIRERSQQHVIVDYFYHAGEYWTALIPLVVAEVYGQSFNFSKLRTRRGKTGPEVVLDKDGYPKPKFSFINHLQTRFQLPPSQSVKLFPLIDAPRSETNRDQDWSNPSHCIDDFIYSVEATGPPGVAFDFKNGLAGTLLCMHRFLSTQEMVFERIVVQGYYLWESPPLPLSDSEKSSVLMSSLDRSDRAGLEEIYYLYRCCGTNNCTSNPFQIVDECVGYSWLQRLGSLVYRLPLNPRLYLRIRGLDSNPTYRKLVRTDFEDYILDPTTQQRKRDVVRKAIRERKALRNREAS